MSPMSKISIPQNIFEQIFFKEGGQKDIAKATVGEYQYGLDEENPITPPNAEVERGEYVKDSQGVREFLGDTHENGGIQVKLEDGSKILSNHLQVGKKLADVLKKELGIAFSPKDTFATVLKKYTKKIGLEEINAELEDLIKKLDKQQKDTKDKGTLALNIQLLANEINEETKEKQPLEEARDGVFEFLFKAQEGQKKQEENKKVFEAGGMYNGDNVIQIASKYGITPERAYELLPKYQDGTLTGEKRKATEGTNAYKEAKKKWQDANKEAFGVVNAETALVNLYRNFPDLITNESVFKDDVEVVDGVPKFKSKLSLNQQNKKILSLQKAMDTRMKSSAGLILENPDDFSPETVKMAQSYNSDQTFIEGSEKDKDQAKSIRDYDQKLGNFTAGRYILGLDLVTPEEKAMLAKEGINNLKQLKASPLRDKLSKSSLDKIGRIEALGKDKDYDFSLSTYTPGQVDVAPNGQEPISASLPNMKINKKLGIFAPPQNFRLTPTQWQHTTVDFRDRPIDPVLMSPEQQLAEISRANLSQQKQIEMLPDSAKASVLAGSGTQDAIQKSVTEVNRYNAQAKYAADVYNAQQKTATDARNAQEALRFDQVSALAQDRYRQDWQSYFTASDNDRRRNYDDAMKLNAFNALNPNVQFTGTQYEVQDPYLAYADLIKAQQLAQQATKDSKGAAQKNPIAKKGGRFKKCN